ncbi:PKD domain-containing protein [Taibaiella sp. KBW10]|uniref:PKD domain-containing protein n=1 Tax=Taibaiella sp. KBW10 TaxID=2153357 RepID=UPI001F45FAF3|nr:PKD domain-containing protein [Taibaiella sp. KBW10]
MQRMKKIVLLQLLTIMTLFLGYHAQASHTVGGDIIYRCLGNNKFEFTFTIYHDCLNGSPAAIDGDNPSYFSIFERNATNTLAYSGSTGGAIIREVVPTGFSNECIQNYPNTCMSRMVFKFTVNLPPSPNGYLFVYQRCCRNGSISNIFNPGNTGVTFTSIIPPFTSGQCPNNSAVFKFSPPQIICANDPLNLDFSATDADSDSLSYELCSAYQGASPNDPNPGSPGSIDDIAPPPYVPVSYIPPYTATSPLSANPVLAIDPVSGILSGAPINVGRYVLTVCVKEWRNGSVINTVSRDLQFVVTNCSRTVIANIPQLSDELGTYIIKCDTNRTVTFTNNSVGGDTYFWDFGVPNTNADTSIAFSPSFTYPDTGVYVVKLVVNKGKTCTDSITRIVKIFPPHYADFRFDGNLCQGSPIQFTDLSTTALPPLISWNWSFGDGTTSTLQNPVHTYNTNIEVHNVRLISRSQRGCMDSITKPLIIPYFNPSAGNDTVIVKGYPFNMNGSGGSVYQWTPGSFLNNSTDPRTPTNFPAAGIYDYNLHITSATGCIADDSVAITVVDKPWFIVPGAFTPNGDGRNDIIKPISVGYVRLVYFKVYNRYGQLVFQTYSFNSGGWDGTFNGKPADVGVYYWHAAAVDPLNETLEQKGDFTLLR